MGGSRALPVNLVSRAVRCIAVGEAMLRGRRHGPKGPKLPPKAMPGRPKPMPGEGGPTAMATDAPEEEMSDLVQNLVASGMPVDQAEELRAKLHRSAGRSDQGPRGSRASSRPSHP